MVPAWSQRNSIRPTIACSQLPFFLLMEPFLPFTIFLLTSLTKFLSTHICRISWNFLDAIRRQPLKEINSKEVSFFSRFSKLLLVLFRKILCDVNHCLLSMASRGVTKDEIRNNFFFVFSSALFNSDSFNYLMIMAPNPSFQILFGVVILSRAVFVYIIL